MCQEQVEKPHGQEAPSETKSQDRCCIIGGCVRQNACTRGPAFGFGDCRCSHLYKHEAVCAYVLWIFQRFYLDSHHHHSMFYYKSPPPKPSDRMPPLDRLKTKPRILQGPNARRMCQEQVEKPRGQEAPPETKSQDRCCIISGCVRQHACTRGPAF